MSRLPNPGQDNGTWGGILNDFLGVEHNVDGTLKPSGSLSSKAAAGANSDITSLSGLTTPLSLAQGGTGSSSKNFVDLSSTQSVGGVKTFSSSPIVPTPSGNTDAANKSYVDNAMATAVWTPSDATGATDMTSELEAFRAAHLGKMVKVADGSTILLNDAFQNVTTGDILVDFTNCIVLYNNNASSGYGIKCTNTANASSEVSVSSMAMVTVNTDATVTRVTIGSTLSAQRFDWIALYSTDANPAIAGGYLGEIFQLLADESSLELTATRKLNKYGSYSANVKARKLDATRRVYIKGGTFKANGNTEDHGITTRSTAIAIIGFVDPYVEDVTFDHPWATGLRFQACAAPKWRNVTIRNVGNLATYQGYTYGVTMYGMNDQADGRGMVVRNGRHPAFTTDGNSSSSSTWYNKGIPTNVLVQGIHGYNCHGSVADTHEEGDNIVISGLYVYSSYQDADISPNFQGTGAQLRASNCTIRDMYMFGGTRGIKIVAVDHGSEDRVLLQNIHIGNLTQTASADGDIGVQIDDQSSLTNKRHVYFDGSLHDVGQGIVVGKTAKLTIPSLDARMFDTLMDAGAGAVVTFTGNASFDYRNNPRTAPYYGILCRSDAPNGGCSVIFLQRPKIIKGASATPVALLTESDATATKYIYVPALTEYNPSSVTPTTIQSAGATTFSAAPVTLANGSELTAKIPVNLVEAATIATDALLSSQFRVTLSADRILGNPTNATDGQLIMWSIKQDGSGGHAITLDSKFRLGSDIVSVTLSTAASKTDKLAVQYNSTDDKFDVIAFVKGF